MDRMREVQMLIGRVTRCSTLGYVGAVRLPEPDLPTFGSYCKAEAQQGQTQVIGLIYDIRIDDDQLARQIAIADDPPVEQLADGRYQRQVPVEYSALAIGYQSGDQIIQSLPPQPPLTLAPIYACSDDEIQAFTARFDYLSLITAAVNIPVNDLLIASLHKAAQSRPEHERRSFLTEAGRACARLLSTDLARLDDLIRRLGS